MASQSLNRDKKGKVCGSPEQQEAIPSCLQNGLQVESPLNLLLLFNKADVKNTENRPGPKYREPA
jgi:hypothetical protein